MSQDSRLEDLYRQWQESVAKGQTLSVQEICSACPELSEPLDQLIHSRQTAASATPDTMVQNSAPGQTGDGEFSFLNPPQGPDELGRLASFRILRVLGQGGMGIVFEAEDADLHRQVAIKVLRPDMHDETLLRRFQSEARIAASLRHDHVVTIYQIGQHEGRPFLVMEYLTGESLAHRLERDQWLPVGEALKIAQQVAEGLAAAHERGLIHRDIKPANVWLEADTPGGLMKRVKILDFGLARTINNDLRITRVGEVLGTPSFMAPEQIYGGTLDGRTDLYSLGCTLYASLTGTTPFQKEDTLSLLKAVVSDEPPDLGKLDAQLPRSVATLLSELLSKDPDKRPASAATVATRIKSLEAGETVIIPKGLTKSGAVTTKANRQGANWGVWAGAITIIAAAVIGLAMGIRALTNDRKEPARESSEKPAPPVMNGPPIRVGVLHSLSGTFAGSERPMVDAIALAVDEINKAGGVLGREIETITRDGHSDPQAFAQLAEELISNERVATIFGCWSSSSRKQVAGVCAKHDNLLLYSVGYEGLEQAPNVVYVGGAPNQQLQPAAKWTYAELHKRKYFLVGSEYVYSHASNEILKDELVKLGAQVVGVAYEPLESANFGPIVERIKQTQADIVMSTVDGTSNIAFFQAMRRAGLKPDKVPIVWLSISEEDMNSLPNKELVGDYVSLAYFRSIEGPVNADFLKRFHAKYPTRRAGDEAEGSYNAVYLWKQAVEKAGEPKPALIREAMRGQTLDAPEGQIRIDPNNLHAWRMARIAKIESEHRFHIEYTSPRPLQPEPFPSTRPREAWEALLKNLYDGWGQHWEGRRR